MRHWELNTPLTMSCGEWEKEPSLFPFSVLPLSLPFPESSFVSHTGPSTGPRMLLRTPGHSRRCCWVHFYPKKTNNLFFSECNWVWTIYEDPVDPKEMNLGFYSYWFPKGLIVHTSLGGSAREGTPWGKTISLPYLRWYLTSNVVKKLTG